MKVGEKDKKAIDFVQLEDDWMEADGEAQDDHYRDKVATDTMSRQSAASRLFGIFMKYAGVDVSAAMRPTHPHWRTFIASRPFLLEPVIPESVSVAGGGGTVSVQQSVPSEVGPSLPERKNRSQVAKKGLAVAIVLLNDSYVPQLLIPDLEAIKMEMKSRNIDKAILKQEKFRTFEARKAMFKIIGKHSGTFKMVLNSIHLKEPLTQDFKQGLSILEAWKKGAENCPAKARLDMIEEQVINTLVSITKTLESTKLQGRSSRRSTPCADDYPNLQLYIRRVLAMIMLHTLMEGGVDGATEIGIQDLFKTFLEDDSGIREAFEEVVDSFNIEQSPEEGKPLAAAGTKRSRDVLENSSDDDESHSSSSSDDSSESSTEEEKEKEKEKTEKALASTDLTAASIVKKTIGARGARKGTLGSAKKTIQKGTKYTDFESSVFSQEEEPPETKKTRKKKPKKKK